MENENESLQLSGKLGALNVNAPTFVPNINAAAFVPSFLKPEQTACEAQTLTQKTAMDTAGYSQLILPIQKGGGGRKLSTFAVQKHVIEV